MSKKQTIIFRKPADIPPPQITERDAQILRTLNTACYLNTLQIQALFWPPEQSLGGKDGMKGASLSRLRRLLKHGYIRRIRPFYRRGDKHPPYIYALDKRGAELLACEIDIPLKRIHWERKNAEDNPSYLRHFLATNDIHIVLVAACRRTGTNLVDWLSDRELKSTGMKETVTITSPKGTTHKASVVPDAAFALSAGEGKSATFFVEVDLGTVAIVPSVWERRGWSRKVRAYRAYLGSKQYHKRYGRGGAAQVLTITTAEARREHLQQATESTGAGMDFWFTTFEEATAEAFLTKPIWYRCGQEKRFSLLGTDS